MLPHLHMQKVLMLPHLHGIKAAQFTRRIMMISQVTVPSDFFRSTKGAQNNNEKPRGYSWHEAVQG